MISMSQLIFTSWYHKKCSLKYKNIKWVWKWLGASVHFPCQSSPSWTLERKRRFLILILINALQRSAFAGNYSTGVHCLWLTQRCRKIGLSDQIVLPFFAKSWQVLKRSYSLARHSSRKWCLSCNVAYSISLLFLFFNQLFLLVGKKPTLQMESDTISSECRWEHLVIASSRNFTFLHP